MRKNMKQNPGKSRYCRQPKGISDLQKSEKPLKQPVGGDCLPEQFVNNHFNGNSFGFGFVVSNNPVSEDAGCHSFNILDIG